MVSRTDGIMHSLINEQRKDNKMSAFKTFAEVLNDRGYDAEFWANAVDIYWFENIGSHVNWFDTPNGVNFAYRLCWELSDGGLHRKVYEMFDMALNGVFTE